MRVEGREEEGNKLKGLTQPWHLEGGLCILKDP